MNKGLARTALLACGMDLWMKLLPGLRDGVLLPGLLALHQVENPGVSFGLLVNSPGLVLGLGLGLVLGLGLLLRRMSLDRVEQLAFGLVLGGALGNLADRLIHGVVHDFFKLLFIRFPVFNLADVWISLGAAVLMVHLLIKERRALA